MSGPVDVLTRLERVARAMDSLSLLDHSAEIREVHSAVSELADYAVTACEYVAKCADAVDVNHRMAGRPNSLNVARTVEANLREAISLVKGGA